MTDESRCKALVERTQDTYGRVDMVINNAGMDVVGKLEDLADLHLFKQVMDVNFYGTVTVFTMPCLISRKPAGGS